MKNFINYANRGMGLESDLNISNEYYLELDKAVIHKRPTPIQVTKVIYPQNRIVEAYFKTPSTTDYNGLYKGHYLDFEAKEVNSKTSFPLSNIHPHQIEHIRNILRHHGIGFIIVRFVTLHETYFLSGEDFLNYIDHQKKKSIPLSYFKEKGYLLKEKLRPRLDYLEVVDRLLEGK